MEALFGAASIFGTLIAIGIGLLVLYAIVRSRYKKAGPDEALIVFGRKKMMGNKVRDDKGEVEAFRMGVDVEAAVSDEAGDGLPQLFCEVDREAGSRGDPAHDRDARHSGLLHDLKRHPSRDEEKADPRLASLDRHLVAAIEQDERAVVGLCGQSGVGPTDPLGAKVGR